MDLTLKVWRQKNAKAKGHFETYKVKNISADSSFLEMLDILNEQLIAEGADPVAVEKGCQSSGPVSFDHDCREGICGACSLYINGRAHGPDDEVTTCQLHMRKFKDGDTITIEPWRAKGFPVIKDLVVCLTVYNEVLDYWESLSSPRLDSDSVTILELTHMELASSNFIIWSVCTAVNIE